MGRRRGTFQESGGLQLLARARRMGRLSRPARKTPCIGHFLIAAILPLAAAGLSAQDAKPPAPPKLDTSRGDQMIAEYFRLETDKLKSNCLADIKTLDDWNAKRGEYRRQLLEMLGLDPLPEKTDSEAGRHRQASSTTSSPSRSCTSSRGRGCTSPAICIVPEERSIRQAAAGDSVRLRPRPRRRRTDVSFGNKAGYQHHGAWFARNGYVCLTIDTLQLGEIEGIHHGTYRDGMWWWLNRGYTPAGVEAWNCVRALDYLRDAAGGRRDPLRRHRPQRRRGL